MTADRPAPGEPTRISRGHVSPARAIALAAVIAAAGVGGAVLGVRTLRGPGPSAPADPPAVSTARVVRTDIVNTIQVSGELSFTGTYTIVNQATGTAYTWLPQGGAVIHRGHELYEVDGTPVTLFYGSRPQWRALSWGVAPGPDVRQLDENLIALGFGAQAGLTAATVSDCYTGATAYAVELWQQAAGLTVTGTVPLGQVQFEPGPVRVTSVTPALGGPAQPGSAIITATSAVPEVIAQLPVTNEYQVHTGDPVSVTLPDGVSTTPGTVIGISTVATSGAGGPQDAGSASGGPQGSGAGNPPDTVAMGVQLTHPDVAGNLDQAPVTVNVTSGQARHVLAVPVSALVALAGGGYAVQVVHGTGAHATSTLVPVQTGLFSSTLVQVSGSGLAVGQEVEVPSP